MKKKKVCSLLRMGFLFPRTITLYSTILFDHKLLELRNLYSLSGTWESCSLEISLKCVTIIIIDGPKANKKQQNRRKSPWINTMLIKKS